jgi:uncharacterized protein YceK
MPGARRVRHARLLAGVVCGALLAGCASVRTLSDYQPGDPVFLSGTRLDLAAIRNDPVALKQFRSTPPAWPWLDLPFSFSADLFFWLLPRMPNPAPAAPDRQ